LFNRIVVEQYIARKALLTVINKFTSNYLRVFVECNHLLSLRAVLKVVVEVIIIVLSYKILE
jgi:hypothetical protein